MISEKCPVCSGKKVENGNITLRVALEKGMFGGEKIYFSGEADESPDFAAGDLIVKIKEEEHQVFTRQGHHLKMKHYLDLKQALLGFDLEIPHLDGDKIKISNRKITQNGI